MWLLDRLAEQRIAQAIERGELDDLAGAGRPLQLDDDALVPEELRVAYRILKNAGFIPPEVQARREIGDISTLLSTLDDPEDRGRARRRLELLLRQVAHARGDDMQLDAAYYEQVSARFR
jgi:hypothetical protein